MLSIQPMTYGVKSNGRSSPGLLNQKPVDIYDC